MSEVKEPVVASLGKPQRLDVNLPTDDGQATGNTNNHDNSGNGAAAQSEEEKQKAITDAAAAEAEKNKLPELTDEQRKEFLKSILGDQFDGNIDNLKAKLTVPAAAAIPPTPEQILATEKEFEKKQLDLYLATGGTVENFAGMKAVLAMDLKELSITDIKKELKEAKFTEEEIDIVLKERYYQQNPDELEQDENEVDTDFEKRKADLKKKNEYATSKIEKRGESIKNNAKRVLENLKTAIEKSELSKREVEETDKKLATTTDAYLSKVSKEKTYELGEAPDGAKIEPVLHNVDDTDIAEVGVFLKDKAQRETKFLTADGELNVEALAELELENRTLKKALKASYLEGGSRQVAIFEKVFPNRTAYGVGLNGNGVNTRTNPNDKKQPASVGKSQRVLQGAQ